MIQIRLMHEARSRVVERITNTWKSPVVAHWVIEQLPLLTMTPATKRPVWNVDVIGNWEHVDGLMMNERTFRKSPKVLLSGGLEGTKGHMSAVEQMYEHNWLVGATTSLIGLVLEPDSYIESKGRKPLLHQRERADLWAESGMVDMVITLPEFPTGFTDRTYQNLHRWLQPAVWMCSSRSPFMEQVITRDGTEAIVLPRIIEEIVAPHGSFLASTQPMSVEETWEALLGHVRVMLEGSPRFMDSSRMEQLVMVHARLSGDTLMRD